MRKTILTAAAAILLMANGVYATNNTTTQKDFTTTISSVGINPFCKAIMQGDVETVKKFIELGEDVNQKSLGMTPVIFAARYNKAEILGILVDNGANLRTKCDKGFTAKKHAKLSGATEALAMIETKLES